MSRRLVLASASPRRREILERVGLAFVIREPLVDEAAVVMSREPAARVEEAARHKAMAVVPEEPDGLIMAFDTAVVIDDECLGKPGNGAEAVAMLMRLSDRWHEVYTGLCVLDSRAVAQRGPPDLRAPLPAGMTVESECTRVRFGSVTKQLAEAYVAQGESLDKAGAYGIQGKGSVLVHSIHGCYLNVVGLPLHRLARVLAQYNVNIL